MEDFKRVDGRVICEICGKQANKHPYDNQYLNWQQEPTLTH